ncbi:MAG TPA: PD-(D/E)XK nuclease family protein, partial [Clostridia bacterium]|nr:PD-(D/E)XK nuclease family protein [Clostridia bacterium]
RVVDYKSSGKNFVLSETLEGLNMQMLIYLFAVWHNGADLYGDVVPAGVLYMPANAPPISLGRNASPEDIEAEKIKNSRMSGMLLNSMDVVIGMEKNGEGIFIPAKLKKGVLEGSLITLEGMVKLKTRMDEMIRNMAWSLQQGKVPAYPAASDLYSRPMACTYCDYAVACGLDSSTPRRLISKLSHDDALSIIDEEGGAKDEMD